MLPQEQRSNGEIVEGDLQLSNTGDSCSWEVYRCKLNPADGKLTFLPVTSRSAHNSANAQPAPPDRNPRDRLVAVAQRMIAPGGVRIKTRKWMLRKYKNCFVGQRAVGWLCENNFAVSRAEAVSLGRAMVDRHMLSHVCHDHDFEDKFYYYRFLPEEEWDTLPPSDAPATADGATFGDRHRHAEEDLLGVFIKYWRCEIVPDTKAQFVLTHTPGDYDPMRARALDGADRQRWLHALASVQSDDKSGTDLEHPLSVSMRQKQVALSPASVRRTPVLQRQGPDSVPASALSAPLPTSATTATDEHMLGRLGRVAFVAAVLLNVCVVLGSWLLQGDGPGAGAPLTVTQLKYCTRISQALVVAALLLLGYLNIARTVVAQRDGNSATSWVWCLVQCLWRSGAEETGAGLGPPNTHLLQLFEIEAEQQLSYLHH